MTYLDNYSTCKNLSIDIDKAYIFSKITNNSNYYVIPNDINSTENFCEFINFMYSELKIISYEILIDSCLNFIRNNNYISIFELSTNDIFSLCKDTSNIINK